MEGFHFAKQNLFLEPQFVLAKFSGHRKAKKPVFEKLYTAEMECPRKGIVVSLTRLVPSLCPCTVKTGRDSSERESTGLEWTHIFHPW